MRFQPIVLALFAFPLWASCQGRASSDQIARASDSTEHAPVVGTRPLSVLIDSLHLDARTIRFHVDKSERRFEVFVNDVLLKTYLCVLGEKPVGDKFCQGDRKTPEGTFTFRSKRRPHQWHVFIWVDYPNAESYRRYNERKRAGAIPSNAGIGGEIGIHGVPDDMDHWIEAGEDWTWGCIALKNADVDEIYPFIVPMRTMMVVEP